MMFHMVVMAGMDLEHSDFIPTNARPVEHIARHTCGSWEIHKSLDSEHYCLLCFRNASFVAIVALHPTGISAKASTLRAEYLSRQLADERFVPSFQRGPPQYT